jgi:hypothetical protein
MKLSGRAAMICALAVIAVSILISARTWPPQSALFPMIISFFILSMSVAFLLVTLFGKKKDGEAEVMDVKRSEGADQKLSNRRLLSISLWLIGFLLLILLFGFPTTIPLFMFLYLKFEGKEGWVTSIGLTVGVWACFYFLFIWLLKTPFPEGWILEWLSGA